MSNPKRTKPSISAGSMADIAFLLLIFFLVTTTIDTDKGIRVKLPPWSDIDITPLKTTTRNLFSVKVNSNDELLVRGELLQVKDLKKQTMEFIANPEAREDLADSPKKAIISFQNDRGTSYDAYVSVYNELRAAYSELWEDLAQEKYKKHFAELSKAEQKKVRNEFPLVISEAEPTDFGG